MDYFPLREGLVLEYRTRSSSGTGGYRFEVVSAATEGGTTRAHCRRTALPAGQPADLTVTKDARGVFLGQELELPLPLEPGRQWSRAPDAFRIDSLDAVKTVPAGTFRGCLRVAYLIAGGDGGSGERFYAPGVGLICDLCAEEDETSETVLTQARLPGGKS
ncbi:MAG: hypothetical protein NTY77_05835 [Elusimicrobia bacterium]|nr:hypothetical protein [Elusimicrobiota bacterium]